MAITTGYQSQSTAGDGSTTVLPTVFQFQLPQNLVVTQTVVATSITTTLVLGTDYTVTGGGFPAATGSVVLAIPAPVGTITTLARATPQTQLTEWQENDAYPANSDRVENALDKLTMIEQEAQFGSISDTALGSGTADASTFLRGDRAWANTLVGPLGPLTAPPPTDVQTLFEVQQNGASAIKVASGIGAQGAFRYVVDGDTNPWAAQWVYDPNIAALGFQAYGGSIKGTFDPVTGDVFFAGDLNVSGTTNSTLFTGAADASLITTGTIDVNRLGSNTPVAGKFLEGTGAWTIPPVSGNGVNTVTTSPFTIVSVNSTQSVPVADATGIHVGTLLYISDGTHTIIGEVTVIASLTLSVKTQSIIAGTAGNTMATGAAVQLSTLPGNNSIQVEDLNITSPVSVSTMAFEGGGPQRVANGGPEVYLYINTYSGGFMIVDGYLQAAPNDLTYRFLSNSNSTLAGGVLAVARTNGVASELRPTASNQVLVQTGAYPLSTSVWSLIGPSNITPASLTPALLNITNSLTDKYLFAYDSGSGHFKQTLIDSTNVTPASLTPALLNVTNALTDTQLFGYDSASGHFKMFAQSSITPGSILPSQLNVTNSLTDTYLFGYDSGTGHFKMFAQPSFSGTTSQFINGAGTATNTLIAPGGSPAQLIFSDASTNQMILSGSGGFPGSISSKVGGVDNHQQAFDFLQPLNIGIAGTALIDTAGAIGSWATEGIIAQGWTRATGGNRSTAGYWDFITFVANPGTTYTADVNTSAYFRFTALANNVVVTITDTTPLPSNSSYRFAGELVIELVATVNTYNMTFAASSGTITWAAGAVAPTFANGQLSSNGTNVIRFTRRQGVSGWIGSVDNTSAASTYTDAQARSAVLTTTAFPSTSATITPSVSAGTSAVFEVTAGAIGNTQLAGNINPNKLQSFPSPPNSAVFLNGAGGWTTPSGGGGSGITAQNVGSSVSGGPFSTMNFLSGAKNIAGVLTIDPYGSTYNVKDYGAVGNGSTDDTTSIAAAITAASSASGGTVIFPPGTYKITSSLTLVSKVNLYGFGICGLTGVGAAPTGVSTIKWGGASGGTMLNLTGTVDGVTIQGLMFDGNTLADVGWFVEALSNSLIQHVGIVNCKAYGIHIVVPAASANCYANVFQQMQLINGASGATCIKMQATVGNANTCHNIFQSLFMVHGNRALDIGWSDNNDFMMTYCFANTGGNYDILLGPDSISNRFFHTEGTIEVDTPTTVDARYTNQVYGYDQSNGQAAPLIHSTGRLSAPTMVLY